MTKKKAMLKDVTDFRDWLTKEIANGATAYDAHNSSNCLVCQYLRNRGFERVSFRGETRLFAYKHVDDPKATVIELPTAIAKIAYGMSGKLGEYYPDVYTFEKALERANKVIEGLSR